MYTDGHDLVCIRNKKKGQAPYELPHTNNKIGIWISSLWLICMNYLRGTNETTFGFSSHLLFCQ